MLLSTTKMKKKFIRHKKLFRLSVIAIGLFVVGLLLNNQNSSAGIAEAQTETGSFVFTAAGDYGQNANSTEVFKSIGAAGTNIHLALGDLKYTDGTDEAGWCQYVKDKVNEGAGKPAGDAFGETFPVELLAGNHEDTVSGDGFIANFVQCLPDRLGAVGQYGAEYYFDYQNTRFIMIAAAGSELSGGWGHKYNFSTDPNSHYLWLKDKIVTAKQAGKWVVVGMHRYCLTHDPTKNCSVGRDLLDLLINEKTDLVLQGHAHTYERTHQLAYNTATCPSIDPTLSADMDCVIDTDNSFTQEQGTVFVIVGTGGQPVSMPAVDPQQSYFATAMGAGGTGKRWGYLKVSATDLSLAATYVGAAGTGTYTDTFRIDRPTPEGTPTPTPMTSTTPTLSPIPSPTLSPTSSPTPSPSPGVVILPAIVASEDAVLKQSSPDSNFGSTSITYIEAKAGSTSAIGSLLKFSVSGIGGRTVVHATLKLYAAAASAGSGGTFYTTGTAWNESSVTWNTAPAAGNFLGSIGPVTVVNIWYEVDVTPAVVGDGVVSFRINSTSADNVRYKGKEGTASVTKKPQLILTVQ